MKEWGGYLRTNNSTDMMDSAMLNGLLATLGHPEARNCHDYKLDNWGIVRCPVTLHTGDWSKNPWNVTRDQLIPLISGLIKQGLLFEAQCLCKAIKERGYRAQNQESDKPGSQKPWYNGADLFFGAEKEFVDGVLTWPKRKFWKLHLRILWHSYFQPLSEPNQLICMMIIAGTKYSDLWKRHNKKWKLCLKTYWHTGSRVEYELCDWVIAKLEGI